MLKEASLNKIYIACGYTDMRKGIDGLAAWIQQQFDLNPHRTGAIFIFCGRKSARIKVLVWEGDGFLLLYKRVAEGRFKWPRSSSELRNLTSEQFCRLLDGFMIDLAYARSRHPSMLSEKPEISKKIRTFLLLKDFFCYSNKGII